MSQFQRIIDLDVVVPKDVGVKIDGELYPLPSDINVPDFLWISRTMDELQGLNGEDGANLMEELYERVLELFRARQPELVDLPIGPRRLGALVVQLYNELPAGEEDDPPTKPRPKTGTRSTSRKKTTRSGSSK